MRFDNSNDDDKRRDYFDGPDIEEPRVAKPVRHTPDEPEYYYDNESQWEHLKPRRKYRFWMYLFCAAVVIAAGLGLYTHYFTPCVTEATQYGYLDVVEQRGRVFKTWEGVLIPYKELMDTTRVYDRDFVFSTVDDKVGREMKRWQIERKPVRVDYKVYRTAVPWRGESTIQVTHIDTVSPDRILPPEFTPAYYRDREDQRDTADIAARERIIEESDEI